MRFQSPHSIYVFTMSRIRMKLEIAMNGSASPRRFKVVGALIGASAVVALGALTSTMHQEQAGTGEQPRLFRRRRYDAGNGCDHHDRRADDAGHVEGRAAGQGDAVRRLRVVITRRVCHPAIRLTRLVKGQATGMESAVTPNQQTTKKRTRVAAIAAGAALTLGALGVAVTEQRDGATLMSDDPTTTISPAPPPPMTTGTTVTETGAPPSPEIPMATPPITSTSPPPG